MRSLLLVVWAAGLAFAGSAADLARAVKETGLDPQECYRVRELTLVRDDARLYLTEGYLIFSKPVAGRRISAVFTAETETGDAELLLMPATRDERRSLAGYAGTPNLDEHFENGILIFTDNTAGELLEQIQRNPSCRRSVERGVLLAEQWTPPVRNLTDSFETRLIFDVLSGSETKDGFLFATMHGRKLGNLDLLYDPTAVEQIILGQVTARQNRTVFDVWTSFTARASRNRPAAPPYLRVSDYRIRAELDPNLRLSAETRFMVRSSRPEARVLGFDLASPMGVLSATVGGQPAEVLMHQSMRSDLMRNSGNSLFLVVPAEPLRAGRDYEVVVRHAGKVVFDAGNHVYYVGARGDWYPNAGLQFATFDLTFRYPRDLDLVTPGEVLEDRTEGEWRVTRRRTSAPVRMAGFNLGRYERVHASRGPYRIEVCANRSVERALQPRPADTMPEPPPVWPNRRRRTDLPPQLPPSPPPSPTLRLQQLAGEVGSALEFMAGHFGPPALPSLTVSPVPGTFGQGFPGLIYLSTLSYFGEADKPISGLTPVQRLFFTDLLLAHETAHQWWGNVVTPRGYHDDWLMESLADYSALLYLEKRKGQHSLDEVLAQYRDALVAKSESGQTVESSGPIVLGSRLRLSNPSAWHTITYGKGSWIMHMLRRRLGDEAFFKMLAELRRRYEDRAVSTEQFRELAAGFLPPRSPDPRLVNFFQQWVYGTGIPALNLSWSVKGRAPNVRLTGRLTQSGVDGEFSALVPVVIQTGRGRGITRMVESSNDPVSFTVTLRQAPVKVLLDPAWSVLRR